MAIQKQKITKCSNCGKPGLLKNNANYHNKIIFITNLVILPFLGYV
jgi:ssDNA-binding Zn-finger/Zn-ribbon topoisomerase 1